MSSDSVLIERRADGLLDIVLNRADKGNLLNAETGEAIIAALRDVGDDVKLARITARGADFCAGRESPMPPPGSKPSAEMLRGIVAAPPLALYDAVKAARVPVLVVARGRSFGAGCALACVADITLAEEGAEFQIPEMERDIPPTLVMSALVGRVPLKTIAYLVPLTRQYKD
ncbi:MAG: enoyl-CoA hydratase/isomerase family protein [Candidatus Protistobacter heckmanni]|nr:enoyl-CoA hydratase/isomerase family protein [Candidatus Protistobacter heckmanni]